MGNNKTRYKNPAGGYTEVPPDTVTKAILNIRLLLLPKFSASQVICTRLYHWPFCDTAEAGTGGLN